MCSWLLCACITVKRMRYAPWPEKRETTFSSATMFFMIVKPALTTCVR